MNSVLDYGPHKPLGVSGSHCHYIIHDDVIKWKYFPRNWPFVREIHRSPVNFPHKGQWRGALMFSLIYVWINDWVNNREAGDLRRQHGHYDVIVMLWLLLMYSDVFLPCQWWCTTFLSALHCSNNRIVSYFIYRDRNNLFLNVRRPNWFGSKFSISWFLMPGLLASPWHVNVEELHKV